MLSQPRCSAQRENQRRREIRGMISEAQLLMAREK
jgi:hypothetical protein